MLSSPDRHETGMSVQKHNAAVATTTTTTIGTTITTYTTTTTTTTTNNNNNTVLSCRKFWTVYKRDKSPIFCNIL
jgi:hypothetical protein